VAAALRAQPRVPAPGRRAGAAPLPRERSSRPARR